jgi:hypothetical protein
MSALLDDVEDSVDAFFAGLGDHDLRIELDEEEVDGGDTAILVPTGTLAELETALAGIAHALGMLRGSIDSCPEELSNLLDSLASEVVRWAQHVGGLRNDGQ